MRRLDELPLVPTDDPGDFDWYPIQHPLGFGAFGVNGFGGDAGTVLSFVAVPDPAVTWSAVAAEDGTLLLAIGAPVGSGFETTWNAGNFERVPRADVDA